MTASSTQPSVPAPDKGKPELLIVADDDTDIARFVEMNLKLQGYEVIVANDGATALALIQEHQPALAIVDLMMPNIDGIELTRRLRANPLTAPMPIIMLTARGQTADKVVGLTAGADDYLVKPFDTLELVARVRSTLRRNQEYREISPLTGLPGNTRILREIADRVRGGSDYAVCHIDIDRFKSVNDAYGFAGGDEFIVVCHPSQVRPLTERAVVDFEAAADGLYDPADAARGYLELTKRTGEIQRANLVTLSIGVAQSVDQRRYGDPREVVAVASEMKTVAKTQPGSYVAVDRRGGPLR